jgi:hypothetical protein
MALAKQSLPLDVAAMMSMGSRAAANMYVSPGGMGDFTIVRQPDAGGNQRYVITNENRGRPVYNGEHVAGAVRAQRINLDESYINLKVSIGLTVSPDGRITPDYPEAPNYDYTLTPRDEND